MSDVARIPLTIWGTPVACCNCGIVFVVEQTVYMRWRADAAQWFHCPNGHKQHYAETTVEKLQKELERTRRNVEFHKNNAAAERLARERTQRRLTATRGAKTRLANRIKNGVCPCCHRTFQNLMRHMSTQHPKFKP